MVMRRELHALSEVDGDIGEFSVLQLDNSFTATFKGSFNGQETVSRSFTSAEEDAEAAMAQFLSQCHIEHILNGNFLKAKLEGDNDNGESSTEANTAKTEV